LYFELSAFARQPGEFAKAHAQTHQDKEQSTKLKKLNTYV
jgi:hypothetical protein